MFLIESRYLVCSDTLLFRFWHRRNNFWQFLSDRYRTSHMIFNKINSASNHFIKSRFIFSCFNRLRRPVLCYFWKTSIVTISSVLSCCLFQVISLIEILDHWLNPCKESYHYMKNKPLSILHAEIMLNVLDCLPVFCQEWYSEV